MLNLKNNKKKIQDEFLNNGFVVQPILDINSLSWIKKLLLKNIYFELKKIKKKIPKNFDVLNGFHKLIIPSELNEFRLKVFKNLNSNSEFEKKYYNIAKPYLDIMGKNIVHAGGMGNGQAAKICNNMILGISMIAVSESFAMAEKLGLSAQNLFDITSSSSSQCWAMTSYLPVPGPVPASPANNDYQPGFSGAMMAKDMKLAQDAAISSGQKTELADSALQMYERFLAEGGSSKDFSAIYNMINNSS